MMWAKVVYIGLLVAGWLISCAKNGEDRGPYDAGSSTLAMIITIGLLWGAGFFG